MNEPAGLTEAVLSTAMDAVIAADHAQRVLLFNDAAVRVFGWPVSEAAGERLDQFLAAEDVASLFATRAPLDANPTSHRPREVIAQGCRRNGERFPARVSVSRMRRGGEDVLVMAIRDLSEQARREAALERSNENVASFVHAASHDLRSPLRSIQGFMHLLQEGYGHQLDARGRDLLDRAARAAIRLEQSTADLLQHAGPADPGAPLAPVPLQGVMEHARLHLREKIGSSGPVVLGAMPVVLGWRSELVALFVALLERVLHAASRVAAGPVAIRAQRRGTQWAICIRPQASAAPRCTRADGQSVAAEEGADPRLSAWRRIVERHGGALCLDFAAPGAPACCVVLQAA